MHWNHGKQIGSFNLAVASLVLASRLAAFASGTVTIPDETNLRAALVGGGTVTFACDGMITLGNPLIITNNSIFDATGRSVTLSGGDLVRVLEMNSGVNLELRNLTIANGFVAGANSLVADGDSASAGGILVNGGKLTLLHCRISGNSARGGAGANGFPNGSGGAALAGAIYLNAGTLNATNSNFIGNWTVGGSGGTNTTSYPAALGSGGASLGGAIYNKNGSLALQNCKFILNQTIGGRAPDSNSGDSGISGEGSGGAFFQESGISVFTGCSFSSNSCSAPMPAGIFSGSGATTRGGAICNVSGAISCDQTGFVDNRVSGGAAHRYRQAGHGRGGAICNLGTLELYQCVFETNVAEGGNPGSPAGIGAGGALYNSGISRIAANLFNGNNAVAGKGYSGGNGPVTHGTALGGAIFSENALTVTATTFNGNWVVGAPAGYWISGSFPAGPSWGGAVYNVGTGYFTNNTLNSNSALGGSWPQDQPIPSQESAFSAGGNAYSGGIFNISGTVFLINNTFSGNLSQAGLGYPNGLAYGNNLANTNGTVSLLNTILANSSSGSNCFGTLTDLGHNLSSDASCNFTGPGSLNNTDPKLGPLDNYGGFTPTMPLLAGSPAIDAGDNASFPANDQRGRTRPFGSAPDIGAFESCPPYVIRGLISGQTLKDEVSVSASLGSAVTTNHHYSLEGLAANTYAVTPQSPDYLFVPANRSISVGPDRLDVNFQAYHWNALSLDGVTNGVMHVVYAATNTPTVHLQTSGSLTQWTSIATNTVGAANYWELFLPIGTEPSQFYRIVKP